MLGGDTVHYAVQNKDVWLMYWDTDTIASQIIFDTAEYFVSPPTQTLYDTGRSSFIFIPYRVVTWDQQSDTTVKRLLVLFDSTVTEDVEAPVITLQPDTVYLTQGDLFDLKDSMTITDEVDSHIVFMDLVKITDDIRTTTDRIETQINFNVSGTYTVNYEIIDTHLNRAKASRTIIVTKATESE